MKLRACHIEYLWDAINGLLLGICLAILLSGCSAAPYWYTDLPRYHQPIETIRLKSAEQLKKACGYPRDASSGCSVRVRSVLEPCLVYLGPDAGECVESHEKNGHCGADGKGGKNHLLTYGLTQDCAYPD